jgi:hypothetical protein
MRIELECVHAANAYRLDGLGHEPLASFSCTTEKEPFRRGPTVN